MRFAVATVRNAGVHARGWYWYYDLTATQLQAKVAEKHGRLIDLDSYSSGGETRYAAIMIRNSGVDKKRWWWWYDVPLSQVQASTHVCGPRLAKPRSSARPGLEHGSSTLLRADAERHHAGRLERHDRGCQDGTLLKTDAVRNRFFDTMIQITSFGDPFKPLVAEEAVAAGKPSVVEEFMKHIVNRAKGGGYASGTRVVDAGFGRMLFAIESTNGAIQHRAYTYGNFYNCADCSGDAATNAAFREPTIEKVRSAIRSALATW